MRGDETCTSNDRTWSSLSVRLRLPTPILSHVTGKSGFFLSFFRVLYFQGLAIQSPQYS